MTKGKITYSVVDETDPYDEFECEGKVVEAFFKTSALINQSLTRSLSLIQSERNLQKELQGRFFNLFHLAAHGRYFPKTKRKLDYSLIYRKRGNQEAQVFSPATLVAACLKADVFLCTACETFNNDFYGVLDGYEKIYYFVAPVDSPKAGDTIVFSLMFYNQLMNLVPKSSSEIKNRYVVEAFKSANRAYKSYGGSGHFMLRDCREMKSYK